MERIQGGWRNVPEHLKCKTELKDLGLKPVGEPKAEVWNRYMWVKLYDLNETTVRKPASAKQLQSLVKARAAERALRICSRCGQEVPRKTPLIKGYCSWCNEAIWIENVEKQAYSKIATWVENKEKYVILDTETTGTGSEAEIVEIAVIDLDENIIYDTLVKSNLPIPEEITAIHGISNEMLIKAPRWTEVWPEIERLIAGKTILIYNAAFDVEMIEKACKRNKLAIPNLSALCVMETYARIHGAYSKQKQGFTWISLVEACYQQGVETDTTHHRAKADCIFTARLIKGIAAREFKQRMAK